MRNTTLTALTALALVAGAAEATTLPFKGFDRLANEADGVVVGTVRNVQSTMDARRDIATFVTFDQLQVVGGRYAAPTLTLRFKGGVVGHERLHVDGVPQFHEGERVLMFVQGNGRDLVPFVGWSQGLFRLVPDGAGDYTVADADGHAVLGVEDDHVRTEAGSTTAGDVQVAGLPDAQLSQHQGGAAQAGGGRSDDGSSMQVVSAQPMHGHPIAAQAFIALARQRAAAHLATAVPLRSVAVGQMPVGMDEHDAASRDVRANAVLRPATDTGRPALPQRATTPEAAGRE